MPRKAWLPAPPEAGTPSAKGRIRFHRHREGTVGVAAAEEEDGAALLGVTRRAGWRGSLTRELQRFQGLLSLCRKN